MKYIHFLKSQQKKQLENLSEEFAIKYIKVFGSYAKNKQRKSSDMDLLVEFQSHKLPSLFKFIELKEKLSRIFAKEIDLATPRSIDRYMRKEVLSSAVPLYERA